MIHIAIVEDENEHADLLEKYTDKFFEGKNETVKISRFDNAISFLDNYKADYDLVFLDIKMPYMNSMDAAHALRELDADVPLIFVTSMQQYAIAGYSVNALDFMVKPVEYAEFSLKMARAYKRIASRVPPAEILLSTEKGIIKINPYDIRYVETSGHSVIYHFGKDVDDIVRYSSLKAAESELGRFGFVKCNSCYLVNLKYVRGVKGLTADVDGVELQISQPKRKPFLESLMDYAGDKK